MPIPDALLIDTRPQEAYAQGHLEGAWPLDLSGPRPRLRTEEEVGALVEALQDLLGRMGYRRRAVLYDEGLTSRLARTAFLLGLAGAEVELWTEGWEEEATSTLPPRAEPTRPVLTPRRDWLLTADEAAVHPRLLDVRSPAEYEGRVHPPCCPRGGRIPGAKNAPLEVFFEPQGLLERLGLEPGEEVGVYCHSGARSAVAFFVLRSLGVRARNYLGSMHEWLQEGLPVLP
ncbi:sulfurtransferase [Thermus filiformis]|uniref:Thiosulfate sulfurtransferase n=1 Tax=Thermus filiformis TaxID=276 RepID=A0A0A2WQZ1_THEFI|nr:rhodanese-like domain-containing protein [Thermus filiformis]KGQ21152.1 thiosulfate sulfurtransferase [Thermus filiformis]